MDERNYKSNLLASFHTSDATVISGTPRKRFDIDKSIPAVMEKLHFVSIGEALSTMHYPKLPADNEPGHMNYNNLVSKFVSGIIKLLHAEIEDCIKSHVEVLYKPQV